MAVLAGCGGDDDAASTPTATSTSTPTAFAPSAPEPPEDPEAQPGGAGDEEPAVTRLALVVGRGGVTPPQVEAPAFLAIDIAVRNDTRDEQVVVVEGSERAVSLGEGRTGHIRLAGLRPGRYRITARDLAATLVVKRSTP